MNEYITIGHIEKQIKKTHPKIADVLLMRIVLRLHKGDIEPLSLLEVTNIQAERNGWAPIPAWLYNEVGSELILSQYLKAGGTNPYGSKYHSGRTAAVQVVCILYTKFFHKACKFIKA